jgi:PWWP domain
MNNVLLKADRQYGQGILNKFDKSRLLENGINTNQKKCVSSSSKHLKCSKAGKSLSSNHGHRSSLMFEAGDLVWALVKGYPYWPALVFPEPTSQETTKLFGKESTAIHVLFLSSRKQTAWVKDTNIVTFRQADQFASILADCPPKVASQFRPTKTLLARYEEAEKVALALLPNLPEERLLLTFQMNL